MAEQLQQLAERQQALREQTQQAAEQRAATPEQQQNASQQLADLQQRQQALARESAAMAIEAARESGATDEATQQAWNEFANRLGQRELPRLDSLFGGTAYRLPPPGAVVENGVLEASTEYPGLVIRYTTDGSDPTAQSTEYSGRIAVTGTVKLSTFDTRGRASRVTTVN